MSRRRRWPASETLNTSGLMRRTKVIYSITSSAWPNAAPGISSDRKGRLAILRKIVEEVGGF
jgi:hypothetical protein